MNIATGSLAHHSRKMGIRESPRMRDRDEKVGWRGWKGSARKRARSAVDKDGTIAGLKQSREVKLRGGFVVETKLLARI